MPVICFHNADEENGYLSNWYPSAFTLKGIDFSSMEQVDSDANTVTKVFSTLFER